MLNKWAVLGTIFIIGMASIFAFAESNDVESETITIQSVPLEIPDRYTIQSNYLHAPRPPCILPSSVSAQVPNNAQVGEPFDVTITPSFELTQQQLDDYNESYVGPEFDNARELWDAICVENWRYYSISHPATYELSGDNVSYYGHRMSQNYFPPYEFHSTEVRALNFNNDPITFQMTIHEPIIYLASDLNDKENMDYLKYDYGRFKIKPATTHVYRTIPPISIHTTIDNGIITLSEFKSDRSLTTTKLEDLNPDDQVIPHPNYPRELSAPLTVFTIAEPVTPITPTLPIIMIYGMLGMIIITGIALFIFNNRTLKIKK